MKKIVIVFMCLVLLCMTFTVSAFADEVDPEVESEVEITILNDFSTTVVLPDNAVLVNLEEALVAGRTYYVSWIVRSSVLGSSYVPLGGPRNESMIFDNRYTVFSFCSFGVDCQDQPTTWVNTWSATNFISSYKGPITHSDGSSGYKSFKVNYPSDVLPSDIMIDTYYNAYFTVPSSYSQAVYFTTSASLDNYDGLMYVYYLCDHIYDNSCDVDCNECSTEREITHTYPDDNDHNCSVCAYTNPEPTHVYVDGNNHKCSQCTYTNPEPTHVYDNDKDYTCNYCSYKRPQPRVWENLSGLSAFIIAIVVEFAVAISKNSLLLLAVVGIPFVGFGIGILSRLFNQRV